MPLYTENEEKVLGCLKAESEISLRDLVVKAGLKGLSSAAYIVNSLEKKGAIKKVGKATRKIYMLSGKEEWKQGDIAQVDLGKNVVLTHSYMDTRSGSFEPSEVTNSEVPNHWAPTTSSGGSNNQGTDVKPQNFSAVLYGALTTTIQNGVTDKKIIHTVSWALVLCFLVLPACVNYLEEAWLAGLVVIALILLLIKKIDI